MPLDSSITDKDYERFFTTLEKIVNSPGPWKQKAAELVDKGREHGPSSSDSDLSELSSWFESED